MIPHSRPTLGPEDAEALVATLASGQLAQGPRVAAFEEAVAVRLRRREGVATSSGTAALAVALGALGVGTGDEVILPAFACCALGQAVRYVGARPILADIGEDLALEIQSAARKLTPRTRAVVVVHPFGHPADAAPFLEWGIPVLEDCAQALGASRKGCPAGSVGALAVCSFYATKLVAAGEGGMVLADDGAVVSGARVMRAGRDGHPAAFNFKLSDLAAALGLAQLARLDAFVDSRRRIASRYDEAIGGGALRTPPWEAGAEPSFSRYVIRVPEAPVLVEGLARRGVEARPAVADPLVLGADPADFPESARAFTECVSLPIFPSLAEEEVELVIEALEGALAEAGWDR